MPDPNCPPDCCPARLLLNGWTGAADLLGGPRSHGGAPGPVAAAVMPAGN